jgi:hypothetical protein
MTDYENFSNQPARMSMGLPDVLGVEKAQKLREHRIKSTAKKSKKYKDRRNQDWLDEGF